MLVKALGLSVLIAVAPTIAAVVTTAIIINKIARY